MQSNYLDAFISGDGNLRVLTACPFCDSHYAIRAARVIAQKDDAHVVHIECTQCGGSIVALILANGGGPQSIGIMTDLTKEEVEKFSGGSVVMDDDAVDVHALLVHNSLITSLI